MMGNRTRRAALRRSFQQAALCVSRRMVNCERLEPRTLLAASDPIISEFMADNTTGLVDGNGKRGDWIEIYNPGASPVDLQGWHLTDNAANPNLYTFPSYVVPAGGYKVVFATSEAVPFIDPAGYAHTNFSLSKGGEYLALSKPDGTATTAFAPSFPPQTSNVSYGLGPGGTSGSTLLNSGAAGKSMTPTSGALGASWTGPGFNDSSWTAVTTGIGFEANTSAVPALTQEDEGSAGNNDTAHANDATTSFTAYSGNLYQIGFNGTISSTTDADYFKLGTMQTGDVLTVTVSGRGATPLSDAYVELYNSTSGTATPIASDDNSGPGAGDALIHRFAVTAANAGTFYLKVRAAGTQTGDYRVGVRLENSGTTPATGSGITAETESNNTALTANDLSNAWRAVNYASVIAGSTNFGTSHDFYKYQFTAGDVVTVYVDSTSAADSAVTLRDASGNALAAEDGTSAPPSPYDLDSFVYSYVIPTTGTYYVDGVRQTTSGNYTLDVYLSTGTPPPHPAKLNGQYASNIQSDMYNKNTSDYLRVPFNVANPANVTAMTLNMKYDGGFVAYLNGVEVARRNAGGTVNVPLAYNAAATADRTVAQATTGEDIDISAFLDRLAAGTNVLAIQGLNSTLSPDTFLLTPTITAQVVSAGARQYFYTPTPGAANIPGAGVVINEIHYNPDVKTEVVDFIELFNNSTQTVNASGWKFTNGIDYTFGSNVTIAPNQYVVLAQDAAQFQAKFGFAPFGQYVGGLSSGGEHVVLSDATGNTIDEVTYGAGFPWPTVGDPLTVNGTGASIQLINPGMDNDVGGDWRSALPTPGAKNSVFAANAAPAIRQVSNAPTTPTANQPVTITAKVTDPDGVQSVNLQYQVNAPGQYVPSMLVNTSNFTDSPNPAYNQNWVTLAMYDDGTHGDSKPGDGVYSAQIPPSVNQNRTLIRYRVIAGDTLGASIQAPYADDPSLNFAYYVYNGVPGWSGAIQPGSSDPTKGKVVNYSAAEMNQLAVYQVIARYQDVIDAQHIPPSTAPAYSGSTELWRGALFYNGVVYDNIGFRVRGGSAWRYAMGKNKFEFNFNRNNGFQAYDNYGNPYKVKWDNFDLNAIIDQGNYWQRGEQGMFEAINLKLWNLVGVPANETTWVQLRVVDDPAEATGNQYQGDLWGMYLAMDANDGNFLEQHDLPDGNYYRMNPEDGGAGGGTLSNQGATQPSDNSDLVNFTNTYKSGTQTEQWWEDNLNLDEYYAYRTIIEAVHHYDVDQAAGKNYYYYHNPDTGLWEVHPWDSDLTWANNMYGGGDEPFKSRVLPLPDFSIAYKDEIRSIRDLLFNTDQTYNLLDELANIIDPPALVNSPVDWDRAMWDYNPILDPATGYTYGDKGGTGRYYAGNPSAGITIPAPGGFRGMVQEMKNYVVTRAAVLDGLASDSLIPNKPTISYTGPANFSLDKLTFHSSNFSSGNSTFSSMEWRIGETYDTSNPIYSPTAERPYEITAKWQSGELSNFTPDVTIPAGNLIAGHTYRVRVRMKDANGRWSNWSAPIQFIAGQANTSITSDLRITEINYNPAPPPAGSPYVSDDYEYVELLNKGLSNLDLTGVKFSNGIDFTFPDGYVLGPGQRTLVVRNQAAFDSRYGNGFDALIAGQYGSNKTLSNSGDHIRLEGPVGQTILDFSYSDGWLPQTDGEGFSMVIIDPNAAASTWGDKASWRASANVGGDPGQNVPGLSPNAVVVNEISANPTVAGQGWIELHNTTGSAIDVSNWFLSDDNGNLTKYRITAGTVIAASGYLVLNEQGGYGGSFTLSRLGGTTYLTQADAGGLLHGYRDQQDYDPSDVGVTLGRYVKSGGSQDFVAMASATPGAANGLPEVGPVVIDEVMYNPAAGSNEYVELRNTTNDPVDLSNWTFDGITFTFPAGTILAAHGYLLVVPIDAATFRSLYSVPAATQIFGPYAGLLDDAGDDLRLLKPGETINGVTPLIPIDRVNYNPGAPWPMSANGGGPALIRKDLSAYGNDAANWTTSRQAGGSPGRPNVYATATGVYDNSTAKPKLSITFTEDVSGTLSAGSLTLTNLGGGSVPATSYSWDAGTLTATWSFNTIPADANYHATLHGAGISDWSGNPFDGDRDSVPGGDYTQDFFYLGGDANHDRAVDFNDLVKLAQNYNTNGGKTWADGDFNGDGNVDFNDLVILAQRYNTSLPAGGAAASVAAPADTAAVMAMLGGTATTSTTTTTTTTPPAAKKLEPQPKRPLPTPPPPRAKPPVKRPSTFGTARIR